MKTTYADLKHEIESHNRRQGRKFVMGEYHESNIYSIRLDSKILKIGSLREVVDALRFLNLYRAETEAEESAAPDMLQALEVAEATIERLNRHDSANGTLDVVRAAIRKAKEVER